MKNKQIFIALIAFVLVFSMINLTKAMTISSIDKPDSISPGSFGDLRVGINNNDNTDIENVVVGINLLDPTAPLTFESSSQKTIDQVNSDDTESVTFRISALDNAKSGVYKVQITASYIKSIVNSTPQVVTTSSITSIVVNSVPQLDVDREEGLLLSSQENTVTFKVVNKGLSDVQFLEVSLDSANLLSPNNVYIGTLASDDSDTAQFKVYLKNSGIVNFPVTLIFRDIQNKQYTTSFNIDAKVYSQQEAIQLGLITKSNTGLIISVIILVIIIYLVQRQIRKYLKNKKKAREMASS